VNERILVVDDEPAIRDAVSYALKAEGFQTETVETGEDALERARQDDFDLLVLDLMLPGLSGSDVCRTVRSESGVPIILLTARDSEIDRVLGLEIGADDYVTKPFSMAELVGRVRALLRRRELDRASVSGVLRVGDLRVDLLRHEVKLGGRPVFLTPSEFRLLALLAGEPERVFSRRELMEHLWESEYVGDQRACDVHIANLRRKLEADPASPKRLVTVRGVGYKLLPAA
jgi:two-component system, OmpR family, response regulator RegX3